MKKTTWILSAVLIFVMALSCNNPDKGKKDNKSDGGTTEVLVENKNSSFDDIINGKIPVLVDFYADWCKPCKAQTPIIDELKAEMGDKFIVVKVNVDIETEIAERYRIQSIPTLMIFREGQVMWKAIGVQQKEILYEAVMAAQ